MAEKSLSSLAKQAGVAAEDSLISSGLHYNRITGNSYTASLFMALASLLDHEAGQLEGKRVGLFSYGSGCMGALFSGIVQQGAQDALLSAEHAAMFSTRTPLSSEQYEPWMMYRLPEDGSTCVIPSYSRNRFRLAAVRDHQRIYEDTARASAAA
jgi:hydroxymethylglutaryl-CoA synthase